MTPQSRLLAATTALALASASQAGPWHLLTGLDPQPWRLASAGVSALLRSGEVVCKLQQDTAYAMAARQAAAACKLRDAEHINDLMTIQAELMQQSFSGVMQYWNQIFAAARKAQQEMLGRSTDLARRQL